jgi:hypothetical protein
MGFVNVQVSQAPPENQFPTQGGGSPVLCDGQQHQVGVTANGGGFDRDDDGSRIPLSVNGPN